MQVQQAAENIIQKKYEPLAVVIGQNMHILYFRGQAGPYIEPATGSASLNLLKMVHSELILDLRALVHQAIKDGKSVRKEVLHKIIMETLKIKPGAEISTRKSPLQPENACKDARDLRISALENELLTEREFKNIEQLRRTLQYERRLAAVVRDSNDAVTVQDFDDQILAWNQRATELFEYSEDVQLNANKLIPDIAREEMHILLGQLQRNEKIHSCETTQCTKNCHLINLLMTTPILRNESNNPVAIAITEREILSRYG